MIVPTAAILKGSQGLFVYVVGDDHTVEVRPVKTGPAAGENTAITSGLDPDEVVVTDGSDRLRDGQRVILPGDCLPAGGMGGRRGGGGGAGRAAGAAKPGGPGLFNLFGLIKTKPAADPMAAMRCKPGQKPAAGLDAVPVTNLAGSGMTASGAAPAGAPTTTTTSTQTTAAPAVSSAPPAAAPAPSPTAQSSTAGAGAGAPPPGGSAKDQARAARMKAMYAPLNLTPDQQAKIGAIMQAQRPKIMAAFQSGDMATAKAARDDMNKQIDGLLNPDQRTKMQAIRAQMQAQRGGGGGG